MHLTQIGNKSLLLFLAILLVIPFCLIAQDISISDFRIPETKYQRLMGNISGSWWQSRNNYGYNGDYYLYRQHSENQQSSYNLGGSYFLSHFNEEQSLELYTLIFGSADYQKGDGSSQYYNTTVNNDMRKQKDLSIMPMIRYSQYITSDKWHWFIEGVGTISYSDYRYEEKRDEYKSSANSKYNRWEAKIGGGIGYGKMRDGQTVFLVLRILDKLQEDSLLTRSLTKEEILNLVNILARISEYIYTQERYVKFLIEDLFTELRNIGVLKNNAPSAYSVLRAEEVLYESIEPRLFGWRARCGLSRAFYEQKSTSSNSSTYGSSRSSDALWNSSDIVQVAFDYGYPLSLNLHFTSIVLVAIPLEDTKWKIDYSVDARGIYQLGERVSTALYCSFSRTHTRNTYETDQNIFDRNYYASVGLSFRFYIENHISFDLSGSYSENWFDYYGRSGFSNYIHGPSIRFGVSYRFI